MKDSEYLYFGVQPYTEDNKRIVKLPNNSLVIYNASVNDTSNNYKCIILGGNNAMVTHRLLVDSEKTHPPQHSHKGIIHVTPSKRVDVNQGHSIRLGCETDIHPSPEIKWFIEVTRSNKRFEIDKNCTAVSVLSNVNDKFVNI